MKILAMSDLHGRTEAVRALLTRERVDAADKVVLCGDYVGYGSDSVGLVRWLLKLGRWAGEKLVLLRGNWEAMLFAALTHKDGEVVSSAEALEIMQGRHNYEKSISPFFREKSAAEDFFAFYERLADFYIPPGGGWLFAHAGVDARMTGHRADEDAIRRAARNSDEYALLWLDESELAPLAGLPFHVVGGHIPFCFLHDADAPYSSGNYVNIDFRASSNYGRLGYVIIDTDTGAKTYKAIPIDARKYAIGKQNGWGTPKKGNRGGFRRGGGTSFARIGNGGISMDDALRIMFRGFGMWSTTPA